MRSMENIEYSFIIGELQFLVGKRFSKIYKLADGKYRLKIGDVQIVIELGVRLNVAKFIEEEIDGDNFVKLLRKELDNHKLLAVSQVNNDRIIEFTFDNGRIVYEAFAKGNLVFVRGDITLASVNEEQWADRETKRGKQYHFPKSNVKTNVEDVISEKYIISSMLKLPLGKEYAKEVLLHCNISEKTPGAKLSPDDLIRLKSEVAACLHNLLPLGFYQSGRIMDYGLFPFSKYSEYEKKQFSTLSEVIDNFYMENREEKNEKIEKLERRLDEQQKRLATLKEEEVQLKLIGDTVYANYDKINNVLSLSSNSNINELEGKLGASKVKVNKKEKEIEIDI